MFFNDGASGGSDANVNRFQGSSSISSAEYFGRQETAPGKRDMLQFTREICFSDMEEKIYFGMVAKKSEVKK